jgi:hypothetical protein
MFSISVFNTHVSDDYTRARQSVKGVYLLLLTPSREHATFGGMEGTCELLQG